MTNGGRHRSPPMDAPNLTRRYPRVTTPQPLMNIDLSVMSSEELLRMLLKLEMKREGSSIDEATAKLYNLFQTHTPTEDN